MGVNMSKYINVDELIKRFGKLTVDLWLDSVEEAEIVSLIGNMPSIDITFCEECECSSGDGTYGCMVEHFNDAGDAYHRMWAGDFCSRGKGESCEID